MKEFNASQLLWSLLEDDQKPMNYVSSEHLDSVLEKSGTSASAILDDCCRKISAELFKERSAQSMTSDEQLMDWIESGRNYEGVNEGSVMAGQPWPGQYNFSILGLAVVGKYGGPEKAYEEIWRLYNDASVVCDIKERSYVVLASILDIELEKAKTFTLQYRERVLLKN